MFNYIVNIRPENYEIDTIINFLIRLLTFFNYNNYQYRNVAIDFFPHYSNFPKKYIPILKP
ncbi:hypothetical protein PEPS_01080 [Persicobacter psychrovividus]|uniref:Uncharacterized protein n=1 Tax=Persicobacter psychrovividus TaxID=387638 RepID=A0ABN6L426_9BACT|nr:hypothetical protein PEPS_01080 [Persicobacter psychrovividus]